MGDYKRLTKWEIPNCASVNGCSPIDKDIANAINRLAELEDKMENDTLVDIETVAKLMVEIMDDCLCNFHDIAEYMYEHCGDWCDKSCDSVSATGDFTPCWVKYLTAKLYELKRGKNEKETQSNNLYRTPLL